MLRQTNVQRFHWADKTMSVLRNQQLEACEKRLMQLPDFCLFGDCDDARVETLWACSFDAQEHPRMTRLHTVQALRAQVLATLPAEAALLSVEEHQLVERLLCLEGQAELLDWEEIGAAESLARRLWCALKRQPDGQVVVELPRALMTQLVLIMSSRTHEEIRERLLRYDRAIRGLLYIGGLLHYEEPLRQLMDGVLKDTYAEDCGMALRYLRTSFDYAYDQRGEMLLLHPGLAEPERMLSVQLAQDITPLELDEETLLGAMAGMLPEERALADRLCGVLAGATRPEISEAEAAEDLRMLAKQGVSLKEMNEVLATLLMVYPTKEMLDAVRQVYEGTPRWGTLGMSKRQ